MSHSSDRKSSEAQHSLNPNDGGNRLMIRHTGKVAGRSTAVREHKGCAHILPELSCEAVISLEFEINVHPLSHLEGEGT